MTCLGHWYPKLYPCVETQNGWSAWMFKCSYLTSSPPVVFDLTRESDNSATIAAQQDSCWGTSGSSRTIVIHFLWALSVQLFHKNLWKWTRFLCSGNQWKYHLNPEGISSSLWVERKKIQNSIDKSTGLICIFWPATSAFLSSHGLQDTTCIQRLSIQVRLEEIQRLDCEWRFLLAIAIFIIWIMAI